MEDFDRYVEEYRELGLNLRHYSNMQFVNLTLALAVQAVLFSAAFRSPPLVDTSKAIVATGGVLMALLFYISEHRIRAYWRAYFDRAEELESRTGFFQYLSAPNKARITSGNAIRILFIILVIFWTVSLFVPSVFG